MHSLSPADLMLGVQFCSEGLRADWPSAWTTAEQGVQGVQAAPGRGGGTHTPGSGPLTEARSPRTWPRAAHWCPVIPLCLRVPSSAKAFGPGHMHCKDDPGVPQTQWTGCPFVNASGSGRVMSCMPSSADSCGTVSPHQLSDLRGSRGLLAGVLEQVPSALARRAADSTWV